MQMVYGDKNVLDNCLSLRIGGFVNLFILKGMKSFNFAILDTLEYTLCLERTFVKKMR